MKYNIYENGNIMKKISGGEEICGVSKIMKKKKKNNAK